MATLKKELKQRELEAFEADYGPRIENVTGAMRGKGIILHSAIAAGWFGDLKVEDVADMPAREVRKLADEVTALYAEIIGIDPKS